LDYFNGTHPNASVSIAIIKLPAKVSIDDPRYGGPVLINPGGPGGSGVFITLREGKEIQTIIDPAAQPGFSEQSHPKYYDILGFDPRGIGWTEPNAECMPDQPSAWSWRLREFSEGLLDSSDAALGRLWSMTHAFGTACKRAVDAKEGDADIKQYMSTASVARDMIEIAEAHAEWVAEKKNSAFTTSNRASVKLHYWGFSYGTYLGTTFASMFPDRVGRLILDGVVSAHDYLNSLGQGSLADTEKDMTSFYTFCQSSGPEKCPLATSTSNASTIEERVRKIIKSLYHHPIALISPQGPELFTYTDLKLVIFGSLYTPAESFGYVAALLAAVEKRGGELLDQVALVIHNSRTYSCHSDPLAQSQSDVPQDAILCGDGVDQTDLDQDTFENYLRLLQGISPAVGPIWATLKMKCAAWPIKPLYTFGDEEAFGGNTSHPILFISNTADPVTPLKSGRLMANLFPGSALLVQDSAGHCSSSQPTPCTMKAIREYFQTGGVPTKNTVCIPPNSPFSLNSTDPSSPFYDPSLGQAMFVAAEEMVEEMEAAKGLQAWNAEFEFFGKANMGQRVKDIMAGVAQFHERSTASKQEL
jgi:pimeloyl-ACP methyl ester carboxylesterase